jgi:anaerobic magnesium-protoporphyrin IX monomethyl ester cyclase
MKILLTHGYFLQEDEREQLIMKPYVPLGILYISAYLEEHGIQNNVFDSTFSSFEKLKENLQQTKPNIIAIYTNLMTKINVIKIVGYVKKNLKDTKIILGGPEIRYYAKDYLDCGAHLVVVGEGEQTTLEVCSYYKAHGQLPKTTPGTAYLEDGALKTNEERPLIKDVNILPMPARDKIDMSRYLEVWKKYHGKSMMSVNTMRGCPYTCKWCSRAVYGGTYRRRSPKKVAEELLSLKNNYNPDAVWFVDDVFTISHKWLKEFAEEVKKQNALIPYEIITRADRMNLEVINLLKESGCFRIWIGAESGSQRIIDLMDRRVEVQTVRDMIKLAKANGIEAGTFIMLGYPGETKSDIRQTITHLQDSDPDQFTVTIAYPIKGTPLYTEVESSITTPYNFETNTDRDLDFKRTHSTQYYRYAIQWVNNEVKKKKEKNFVRRVKMNLKSQAMQVMMAVHG